MKKGLILFHSLCAPRTQDSVRLCGHLLNEQMSPHHCLWRRMAENTCYVSRSCLFLFSVSQGRPDKRSAGNNSRISYLQTFVFLCLHCYVHFVSWHKCERKIVTFLSRMTFGTGSPIFFSKDREPRRIPCPCAYRAPRSLYLPPAHAMGSLLVEGFGLVPSDLD